MVVDRNGKDALRPVYYEDAVLEGLLTAGGQSDAGMSYFTVRQADTDLSSEFVTDDEEAKTSEEDIESAARSLAGRSAYLLVYQPRATAKTEPFTGLTQLEATIDYRLYDIDKREFVADDSVEVEDEYLTGCATTIAGQSSDPLCIKAFVAQRLRTLASELGRGLAVNLARRQQAR
ncbi:hypothetical protein [Jiella marina]|uniref:hypothetical protein n=1 Tax=Jiella sp. LLJ827 TaxID=2917712 RepID=UPI0021008B35|nr:hypothetical protein [Jiella sp. LLJ827]MCQ0989551.1 hypothetical protein [Jiella sp. LLJ827]